jgi:hypothetical protein
VFETLFYKLRLGVGGCGHTLCVLVCRFHHLTQPESRRSSRQQRLFLHRYLRDDCRSVTDVLNMVSRERPEVFDARLVSATFRNLVRTSSRHRHAIKAVCRHPAFNSLLSLAQSRVSSMEGQQLSVVAWALALFHCHQLQLWTLIEGTIGFEQFCPLLLLKPNKSQTLVVAHTSCTVFFMKCHLLVSSAHSC